MRIPQVGIDAIFEQVAEKLVSTVSIAQMGPGIDALAHAPTRALIGTKIHGHTGGGEPLGRIGRDERAREQAEHMRDVAMIVALGTRQRIARSVFVEGILDIPLFDLPIRADLDRGAQIIELLLPYSQDLGVLAHDFACLDGIVEQLPNQSLLIGVTSRTRTMLGRIRRRGDVLAVFVPHEQVHVQLRLLAECGIDVRFQVLDITRVTIGIIRILQNPGDCGGGPSPVEAPTRAGPSKGRVLRMGHKAVCLALAALDARIYLGGHTAGLAKAVDIGNERASGLRKVRGVDRPVIHLQIDIHVIVRRPRRVVGVVPHTLQVAGELGILTRRCHGQVTTILVQRGLQQAALRIGSSSVVICLEQLVGRVVRSRLVAQIQIDAAHERVHIGDMFGANGVIALRSCGVGRSLNAGVQLLGRLARTIRRIVVLIIRCRGNEERDLVGAGDNQFVTGCRDGTALGLNLEDGIVFELVIGNSARKGELIGRGNRLAALFGRERDFDVHRFTLRGELAGDHVIGVAGKEFTLIRGTTLLEGDAGKAILDIKGTLVFACPGIREAVDLKVDVTPGLISSVAVLRTHKLIAQGRGLATLALGKELLDVFERCAVIALVIKVAALIVGARRARTTRPKGLLIEREVLGCDLTVHIGAHIAVADG